MLLDPAWVEILKQKVNHLEAGSKNLGRITNTNLLSAKLLEISNEDEELLSTVEKLVNQNKHFPQFLFQVRLNCVELLLTIRGLLNVQRDQLLGDDIEEQVERIIKRMLAILQNSSTPDDPNQIRSILQFLCSNKELSTAHLKEGDLLHFSKTHAIRIDLPLPEISAMFSWPISIIEVNNFFSSSYKGLMATDISTPPDITENGIAIWNFSHLLKTKQGSCVEVAAIVQILHQQHQKECYIINGTLRGLRRGEAHTWNVISEENRFYILDASMDVVTPLLGFFANGKDYLYLSTGNYDARTGQVEIAKYEVNLNSP